MADKNVTQITMIHLTGFQASPQIKRFIFFLLLIIFFITMCGNLLIIFLVSYSKSLHSPMYFFLTQLSVSDILLVNDINLLHVVSMTEILTYFTCCIIQFYFFGVSENCQCLLLTVMSYDRYLAICKPLHYPLIMNHQICWTLIATCWTLSLLIVLIHVLNILNLQFCSKNVIDHFYCDLDPILELSCSNTIIVKLGTTFSSVAFGVIPFFIIIISYVYIIVAIFKIPSITGRQKVFSTCSSHLTIVCIYYGTLICVYTLPERGQPVNMTKFLSLLYTVVTPLLNPIIYSLRNEDLKKAMQSLIKKSINFYFSRNKNV